MQSDSYFMKAVAVLAVMVMALGTVSVAGSSDAADAEYNQDLGQFWSYTVQFIFNGSGAQTINWDFGDGSAPSSEFDPRHEYPAKGVYIVTQTTTNTMGETVEHYRVEIMGFPHITLVYDNGSENGFIQQTAYKVAAEKPVDPVKDGSSFKGWFTGPACTSAYDWSTPVTEPLTLYAGWAGVPEVTFVYDNGSANVTVSVGSDGKVQKPADPARDGYTFKGWFTDADRTVSFDFTTVVTTSATLYAGWEPVSGPSGGDDPKDDGKDETTLYIAIGCFIAAIGAVVVALVMRVTVMFVPAVIAAIGGVLSYLMYGGLI